MASETQNVQLRIILAFLLCLVVFLTIAYATPTGPSITQLKNETKPVGNPTMLNESTGGGYIYTVNVSSISQDMKWKAYVGNVTGKWVLQDSDSYSIYEWGMSATVSGEIYATRKSTTVSWDSINCTWVASTYSTTPNANYSNRTIEENENLNLGFSRTDDNLTTTFSARIHSAMSVGTRALAQDSCYAIKTYVSGVAQSGTSYFQELLLYDGPNVTTGTVVYATFIEQDRTGFDSFPYDFQLIVPNNASVNTITVPYYFYIELD